MDLCFLVLLFLIRQPMDNLIILIFFPFSLTFLDVTGLGRFKCCKNWSRYARCYRSQGFSTWHYSWRFMHPSWTVRNRYFILLISVIERMLFYVLNNVSETSFMVPILQNLPKKKLVYGLNQKNQFNTIQTVNFGCMRSDTFKKLNFLHSTVSSIQHQIYSFLF